MPDFQHGTIKKLIVVPELLPKETIANDLMIQRGVIEAMWDLSDNGYGQPTRKWKVNYNNGFVGWWEDKCFYYEGKSLEYQIKDGPRVSVQAWLQTGDTIRLTHYMGMEALFNIVERKGLEITVVKYEPVGIEAIILD